LIYYFFDSSALIKRYHTEIGTERIDEILEQQDSEFIISSLALSEVTSALNRKKNEGKINPDLFKDILIEFYREVLEKFTVISLDDSLLSRSIELILNRNLRTLDSLQLSVALSVFDLLYEMKFIFVCSDKKLLNAAKQEGLEILDPELD
jgi:predicted nucleic acid-binding protein